MINYLSKSSSNMSIVDCYMIHNNYRIGPDRTLSDGVLWTWLELSSIFEYLSQTNSLDLWSIPAQQKVDEIVSNPTFSEDSLSFCTELIQIVEEVINSGFDYQNYYDMDTLRAWGYAKTYIETPIKCISEE